jgi:hypothetical protein
MRTWALVVPGGSEHRHLWRAGLSGGWFGEG